MEAGIERAVLFDSLGRIVGMADWATAALFGHMPKEEYFTGKGSVYMVDRTTGQKKRMGSVPNMEILVLPNADNECSSVVEDMDLGSLPSADNIHVLDFRRRELDSEG